MCILINEKKANSRALASEALFREKFAKAQKQFQK